MIWRAAGSTARRADPGGDAIVQAAGHFNGQQRETQCHAGTDGKGQRSDTADQDRQGAELALSGAVTAKKNRPTNDLRNRTLRRAVDGGGKRDGQPDKTNENKLTVSDRKKRNAW